MVAFAIFSKDAIQDYPSHSQSDYDAKLEAGTEEVISKDESPGIKTIKSMTQNTSSISEKESKRKRKRKADKISDRRSKEIE